MPTSDKLDTILARVDAFRVSDAISRSDSDWSESDHPRDGGGQFSNGGGGSSGGKSYAGTEYHYAGQPPEPGSTASSNSEKNQGYGGAGITKHGTRIQHAWEKDPRPGDHRITPPPAASTSESGKTPKTAQGAPASTGKSKAAFVNEFMKAHKNREQDLSRLSQLSDEKLKKALELIEKHNVRDEDAKYMKELIKDVLKSSK